MTDMLLRRMYTSSCNRLRQWARVGIGRLTGSTSDKSGKYKAALDLEESRLIMRAELTAVQRALVLGGVVPRETLLQCVVEEMKALEDHMAKEWPEVEVTSDGSAFTIKDVPAFAERVQREGWPQ